jgi:hypothetical protein
MKAGDHYGLILTRFALTASGRGVTVSTGAENLNRRRDGVSPTHGNVLGKREELSRALADEDRAEPQRLRVGGQCHRYGEKTLTRIAAGS